MDLSPTGKVILGFLVAAPRSGYDIKQIVDQSTRFFWAASYGQIYPELKSLAAEGLIEPADEPEGGRRRTVYRVTTAGRAALGEWIHAPGLIHELRDEGLLKVFFADLIERQDAIAALEATRASYVEKLETLRGIEELAASAERFGPHAVLRFGLGMSEFAIAWCDEHLAQLRKGS